MLCLVVCKRPFHGKTALGPGPCRVFPSFVLVHVLSSNRNLSFQVVRVIPKVAVREDILSWVLLPSQGGRLSKILSLIPTNKLLNTWWGPYTFLKFARSNKACVFRKLTWNILSWNLSVISPKYCGIRIIADILTQIDGHLEVQNTPFLRIEFPVTWNFKPSLLRPGMTSKFDANLTIKFSIQKKSQWRANETSLARVFFFHWFDSDFMFEGGDGLFLERTRILSEI